jgi:signal transduction histidine kinase
MPSRFLPALRELAAIPYDRWGLPADVTPALERHLHEWLRIVTWGVGGLWVFFACAHPFFLPEDVWRVVAPADAVAALVMFVLAVYLRRLPAPRHGHLIALLIAAIAATLSLLHLGVSGEGWQTTNLMLVLVGGGVLFTSTRAFLLFTLAVIAIWLVLAPGLEWHGMRTHYGFALGNAAFLALLVQTVRRRTTIRSERLRLRERDQRNALLGAAQAIQDSERRAAAVVEALPDMLVSLDESGSVIEAHIPPGFPTTYATRALIGRAIEDLLPEPTVLALRKALARTAASGRVETVDASLRIAGARRFFELRVVAAPPGALVLARDVSERVRREMAERTHVREALRVTAARLDAVIAAIPILVVAFDAAGHVTLAEGRGLDLLGIGLLPTDLLGAKAEDLARDLPELAPALSAALGGQPSTATLRFGDSAWEARLTPVLADDQTPAGAVAVVVDVTLREAAEHALREAKESAESAARLKDAFLANMSHEIRTPMAAILGFAELLAAELPADAATGRYARHIRDGGKRLLALLNNILDMARLEADRLPLSPTPHRLAETVENVCGLLGVLAVDKGLALHADIPDDLWVRTDPAREEQVLTNIVGNAIRFTEQGTIAVTAKHKRKDNGDWIIVEVADTGIGIDPAFLPHIFDEFRQESEGHSRSHEGSGLGLAIARRLVERMGGAIDIRSQKGVGTTVTLNLPAAATAAA